MQIQKSVMWEVNWLQITAHLTHRVPPAALPGGRAPDGQRLLSRRPKTETQTGPVYPGGGCLSGAAGGFEHVCVGAWKFTGQRTRFRREVGTGFNLTMQGWFKDRLKPAGPLAFLRASQRSAH